MFFQCSEKKICLKGDSTQHLLDLKNQMSNNGLECYLVRDAGHTQVAAGSVTVLSGFGKECELNKVTGKLKLLWVHCDLIQYTGRNIACWKNNKFRFEFLWMKPELICGCSFTIF